MTNILTQGFDTTPLKLEPMWQIAYIAPKEDIDRIFETIRELTPLVHGKTDTNGYRTIGGFEYYRPLAGTPTGEEEGYRKRPDVDEMRVVIPRDEAVLRQITEAIYEVSSYYEPVIIVSEILRSATKGLDDSQNPHRWWNKGGDWKTN